MQNIVVIPDTQVDPGYSTKYLKTIGNYIVAKRPDRIIHLGDFSELASLSSYDKNTIMSENRRYKQDLRATHEGNEDLLGPLWKLQKQQGLAKVRRYRPKMTLLLGNHENRIIKTISTNPVLAGTISTADLKYEEYGWEVVPFLQQFIVDDVVFVHYLVSGNMDRPIGSANAILKNKYMSAVVGHRPGLQIAMDKRADGRALTAVMAGSCYEHDMGYFSPQTNKHFRGILHLYDVEDGSFLMKPVTLDHLKRNYSK